MGRNPGDAPGPHALTAVAEGARAYAYDANGNMTSLDDKTLEWDFKDRLVAVEDAAMRVEYAYDYTDRRISKQVTPKLVEAAAPCALPATSTLYVNRHFEVRDDDEPVKYAFNGQQRVARITRMLDASQDRVQRFAVRPGWNLLSLGVEAVDAAAQLGLGSDATIAQVYRWDAAAGNYVAVTPGDALPAGSIFWLQATAAATLGVRGSESASGAGALGPGFARLASTQAASLDALASQPEALWSFDPAIQQWRGRFPGALAQASDGKSFLGPGEVVFVQSAAAIAVSGASPATEVRYYHADHLGSTGVVSDADGNLVEEIAYYPFGHPRNTHRPAAQLRAEPYQFTQKERDRESGLHYFEARYLAASLGRFASVDPLSQELPAEAFHKPQSLNPYSYGINNPFAYKDPTGEWIESAWDAASLALSVAEFAADPSLLSGAAVIVDAAAVALPFVPGGAGVALKSSKIASKVPEATKGARFVYDGKAGRYRDLSTGRFVAQRDLPYPSNAGFASRTTGTVKTGTVIDRYGKSSGRFASEAGTSASQRGIPRGSEALPFRRYEVVKPIRADVGPAAAVPEFGATGGAKQYLFGSSTDDLVKGGYLKEVR